MSLFGAARHHHHHHPQQPPPPPPLLSLSHLHPQSNFYPPPPSSTSLFTLLTHSTLPPPAHSFTFTHIHSHSFTLTYPGISEGRGEGDECTVMRFPLTANVYKEKDRRRQETRNISWRERNILLKGDSYERKKKGGKKCNSIR